jgi:hypothetical protein
MKPKFRIFKTIYGWSYVDAFAIDNKIAIESVRYFYKPHYIFVFNRCYQTFNATPFELYYTDKFSFYS